MFGRLIGILFLLVLPAIATRQLPAELSSIKGVVLDAVTRAPVPGVRVTGPGVRVTGPSIEVRIVTDNSGNFLIENVYPGRVLVTFRKPGYVAQTVPYDFIAGQAIEDASILLFPTGVITGRITNRRGEPAARVEVTVLGYRARNAGRQLVRFAVTQSDDRGEYRMIDIPSGRYFVTFGTASPQDEPQIPKSVFPTVYPGGSELSKVGLIEIRGGEDLRLRDVQLESDQGTMPFHFINGRGESAKDVVFQIGYHTPFSDSTTAGGEEFRPATFHIDAGETVSRTIWPGRFGVYSFITNWAARDGAPTFLVTPVEFNGQTRVTEIVLSPPNGHLKIRAIIQQPDGKALPLATAQVGICRAAMSACSSSQFWVSKVSKLNSTSTIYNVSQTLLGSDGFLDLPPVIPDTYELYSLTVPNGFYVASARQGERDALTDGILISEDSPRLDIEVRPGAGTLRGRVNDRQGHAVQDALVALLPESPLDKAKLQALRRAVRTDPSGSFEVQNLIPGNYRAFAWIGVQNDAYLDADFVANFDGVPIHITTEGVIGLTALNER